jgi:hypothetical protein
MAFDLIRRPPDLTKDLPKDWPIYWILYFPFYGKFVFYGTELEAEEIFLRYSKREGAGLLRKADSTVKKDLELVRAEIDAVLDDRRAGIKNLPYLPREAGF